MRKKGKEVQSKFLCCVRVEVYKYSIFHQGTDKDNSTPCPDKCPDNHGGFGGA